MPFEFEVLTDTRTILARSHGIGSLDDILHASETLEALLAEHRGHRLVIDNTGYNFNADTADLERITKRLGAMRAVLPDRIGVVVRPGVQFGIGRMFGTFAGFAGVDVVVTSTVAAALEALDK